MMKSEKVKEKKQFPFNQVIAAVICNIGAMNSGMGVGWLSPALPQMRAEGGLLAPLDPDLATTLASWMAGIFALSGLFFMPLVAIYTEILGRKVCAMTAGIPYAINAIIILSSDNVYHLLFGRFMMGIGIALALLNIPTYIGETSDDHIRGVLGAFLTVGYTLGITASYLVGGFISYNAGAVMLLVFAVLSSVLFLFVPETPAWLVRKGKLEKAAKSVAWLWRADPDDLAVRKELMRLQEATKVGNPSRIQAAKQLVLSKPLRRGFLLCVMSMAIQGWMGMIAVHSYSVTIFLESGAGNLSAEGAAAIYGSIQIMGALSVTSLIERSGRKMLMASSSFLVALFMFIMGTYFHLQSQGVDLISYQWVPVVALSLCVFSYTIGAGSVPFILISDLLTNEVRSVATMVVVQIMFLNSFLSLRFFAPAVLAFGNSVIFFFFGAAATIGGLTAIFLIPETKGKSTEQIQEILSR